MAKGAYIGVANEQAEHYKVLEYIECTGTQYINTGFVPNQDSGVLLDFQAKADGTSNQMFGSRYNSTSRAFSWEIISGAWTYGYKKRINTGITADGERHTLQMDKNVCVLDGTTICEATYSEFEGYRAIAIGRIRAAGSEVYRGYLKIYSCKLYDNGTLIRDYIPCIRSDGEAGLYDLVNAEFYANAGSGEFVLGEETGEVIGAGVAQEISDCYIGIDGVAQEVRRAYIGDENGIAQVCYSLNPYFIPAGASRLITADGKIFECKE